jgi:predicted extracellular nuclease
MNDVPQAATTQILHGPRLRIDTPGYDRPDRGDAQRLWNLAARIPEKEGYSRVYRARTELIDHLFVSHRLLDTVETVTTGTGSTPSITDNPVERRDPPASDHRPVVARLNL